MNWFEKRHWRFLVDAKEISLRSSRLIVRALRRTISDLLDDGVDLNPGEGRFRDARLELVGLNLGGRTTVLKKEIKKESAPGESAGESWHELTERAVSDLLGSVESPAPGWMRDCRVITKMVTSERDNRVRTESETQRKAGGTMSPDPVRRIESVQKLGQRRGQR